MKNLSSKPIAFFCNICQGYNIERASAFHRERVDCHYCGSTPRFRGTVYALSEALFGMNLSLSQFPIDKSIRGIGMSEWLRYAEILEDKFDFINSYFHQEPFLDITDKSCERYKNMDFILCMEVLEHILPPVEDAIENMKGMLSPDGVLILSTPFTDRFETQEHFEGLYDYRPVQQNDGWVVVNKDRNGNTQIFNQDIHFHGGPGSVLEMRLFSQRRIIEILETKGFDVEVHDCAIESIGYYWPLVEERQGAGVGLHYILSARLSKDKPRYK